jgi:eukaryotic-like serine/threonine-protein kinase
VSLAVGDKLGRYEILAPIGKGGMGEVYRARDTRLNRDVAIKVSAEQFSERFEREARAIAALNHPNICHLYDVGPDFLVMELVDGPTLADRIQQGAIPLEEALVIARQIADALEAAHEKGVVHRDLKPGNVKMKSDGTMKVLDFGLAKMGGTPILQDDHSPTMTMGQTQAGMILGTASYMSPEQAKGKPVDARSDIYAFGAVLYEMLTGTRLHQGETTTDVLASVIKEEPRWDKVPPQVQRLLRLCLQKDPQKRLRHIGDVMALLDDAPTASASVPAIPRPARATWTWVAAGTALLAVIALATVWFLKPAPDQPMLQLEITPPDGVRFTGLITPFALSPDGRRIVFMGAGKDGKTMLWLRSIDSSSAVALPGTENGEVPFWSPDSRWVGFSANGKLQRLDIAAAGQPEVICDIEGRSGGRGIATT